MVVANSEAFAPLNTTLFLFVVILHFVFRPFLFYMLQILECLPERIYGKWFCQGSRKSKIRIIFHC